MTLDIVLDVLSSILLIMGALLSLIAGIGLMRFSDLLSRMHAGTKPQVFGLLCVMLAVALQNPGFAAAATIVLVVGFQMLTVPISAHMVGRAAYRTVTVDNGLLGTDQLADAVARAEEDAAAHEAGRAPADQSSYRRHD